ncbi:uncharacterized protein Ecym_4594 [Eremothecium cymbalariae DBVPG|uniref:Membrane protein PTM1 n=1 Tax=Eremothecium cymbalariae (strain CBS 270.75 / DBVPG 7215 / KCTC 17166 / NRRL Y-17582) TaxID=931890 RepID=G8JSA4_ERECY|nr:hypothetical protein Ecym_4594 [Eremothecium cymbalariae DBVPG\
MLPQLTFVLWFFICSFTRANKERISSSRKNICSGMYDKTDWGGKVDPFISFNLTSLSGDNNGVSVVIFEYQDLDHVGIKIDGDTKYICNDDAINQGLCNTTSKGNFLLTNSVFNSETGQNETAKYPILTYMVTDVGEVEQKYNVKKTGYYCVLTEAINGDYNGIVNYRNAFGELPASEINKMPLYGLLAVAYAVGMALYSFAVWKHKHELLLLQKYLLAFFVFLTIDTIFIWSFYDLRNRKGSTLGTNVFMLFVSVLSAGKVSCSCFFLLVITLGYGIVYPKLNRKLMRRIQAFTLFNFFVSAGFLIQDYMTSSDAVTMLPLITLIPSAFSLVAFYCMIIKSLGNTTQYLKEQRQMVKLNVYRELLAVILLSMFGVAGGMSVTTLMVVGMSTVELVKKYWRIRFIMDFWPSLIYYCVFVTLAFMLRPTDTSYMLACSQQLPTDPENVTDFDLDDLQSLGDDGFSSTAHDDDLNFSDDEHIPRNHNERNTSK